MSVRDHFWTSFVVENGQGQRVWPCPRCRTGYLVPKKDAFAIEETAASKATWGHEDWEPDWREDRFSGMLVCDNGACGDPVVVCGKVSLDVDQDPERDGGYYNRLYPTYVMPAPRLFPLPRDLPPTLEPELQRSFSLFWCDPSGCANAIRSVIEGVLTDRGIKRYAQKKGKKRSWLSLHARIELYKKKNPDLADAMFAVKWIGNAGSHSGGAVPTQNDLFDGFDLLEHVLIEIYDQRSATLRRLSQAIKKKKGPLSKKRHRK